MPRQQKSPRKCETKAVRTYKELVAILTAEQRPEVTLHFPFQRLPPEIRNKIYRLLLVKAGVRRRLRKWDDSLTARARAAVSRRVSDPKYVPRVFYYTALSILGVSRQLHNEALGIFYYHNTLCLWSVSDLRDFLTSVGPRRRASIRNVRFIYIGMGSPAAFKLLATCENLTKLHINVASETLSHCRGQDNLLNTWGIGHLLKIRGLETVKVSQIGPMGERQVKGFEEAVRNALLQPRKAIKGKKPAANRKQASKDKNVAAGKKRTFEDGKAPQAKKTKLVHDGTQIVNGLAVDAQDG